MRKPGIKVGKSKVMIFEEKSVNGESNESENTRFTMSINGEGMSCGVKMVQGHTLQWSGHLKRMGE